jgi:holin-like protein
MESSRVDPRRPIGITVIVVLMWIQGIFGVLAGLIIFFERNDAALATHWEASSGTFGAYGIIAILVGLATIVLAVSLGRGSNVVRIFIGIIAAFNLGVGIWGLFAFAGTAWANAIWQIIIAGVILYILFGSRASQEFFGD